VGIIDSETIKRNKEKSEKEWNQKYANDAVSRFVYIKDPRTNLCFVYFFQGGNSYGGPALATVPEESIPKEMLFIAESPEKK
jgi:hypothetical protein